MEVSAGDEVPLIIGKQRNGPDGRLMLAWFKKRTRFENFPLASEADYPLLGI